MAYTFDETGCLDLSGCMLRFDYDKFAVEEIAREYYYAELTSLVAWDGTPIKGMQHENQYRHMVCKHGRGRGDFNILMDLDVKRVARLPILKQAVTGMLDVDVYRQTEKNKNDKVEVVVHGPHQDYVVALGCRRGCYIVHSAYPADETYVEKIRRTGELIEEIRP